MNFTFIQAHYAEIVLTLLTLDRILERLFPNAALLKKIDALASMAGAKDADGQ